MARRALRTSLGPNNGEKKCRCFVVAGAGSAGAGSLAGVDRSDAGVAVAAPSLSASASEFNPPP